jgi:hypothetical protein
MLFEQSKSLVQKKGDIAVEEEEEVLNGPRTARHLHPGNRRRSEASQPRHKRMSHFLRSALEKVFREEKSKLL